MQIFEALTDIMGEIEAVTKNKTNQQQNYKYRSIDDVYNMIQPIFGKHKVFILPKVVEIKEEERQSKSGGILNYVTLTMDYSFYASDGSCVTTTAIGKAMDSGDKALDKAKSSAMKYLLLQMFLIPTEEDKDTEQDDHQTKPAVKPQGKPADKPVEKPQPPQPQADGVKPQYATPAEYINRIHQVDEIDSVKPITTSLALSNWLSKHTKEINSLPKVERDSVMSAYKERYITLQKAEAMTEGDA